MSDGAAFEGFYRANLARIVQACALLTLNRSIAEEIAAEAFTRLWSRWGQIESEDHAGGYVFKTAMRLCARELKTRARSLPSGVIDVGVDQALARQDIAAALAELPLRQRQAVVLRDWAGFDTREVARMLGTRESTTRVHLARGRSKLRAALAVDEDSSR